VYAVVDISPTHHSPDFTVGPARPLITYFSVQRGPHSSPNRHRGNRSPAIYSSPGSPVKSRTRRQTSRSFCSTHQSVSAVPTVPGYNRTQSERDQNSMPGGPREPSPAGRVHVAGPCNQIAYFIDLAARRKAQTSASSGISSPTSNSECQQRFSIIRLGFKCPFGAEWHSTTTTTTVWHSRPAVFTAQRFSEFAQPDLERKYNRNPKQTS